MKWGLWRAKFFGWTRKKDNAGGVDLADVEPLAGSGALRFLLQALPCCQVRHANYLSSVLLCHTSLGARCIYSRWTQASLQLLSLPSKVWIPKCHFVMPWFWTSMLFFFWINWLRAQLSKSKHEAGMTWETRMSVDEENLCLTLFYSNHTDCSILLLEPSCLMNEN